MSWPIILGQLGTILMGFTDVLFVGKLGHEKIAAAGSANSVYFFISVAGIGVMAAVSALVARYRGEGRDDKVEHVVTSTLWTAIFLGTVFTILVLVFANNYHWFQQPEAVNQLAPGYLRLWAFSTIPLLIAIGLKNFCDGLEYTWVGMVITLAGLGLNCLLNYMLIWGHWGCSAMGFEGSALASLITRIAMAAATIIYIVSAPELRKYLRAKHIMNMSEMWQILKLGLPTGLQYLFEVGAFAGAALLMGNISVASGAAHQVALNLASVTYMVSTGVSAAGSILTGHAFGREHAQDIHKSGKAALWIILIFMALTAAIFVVFNNQLPLMFTQDPEVLSLSATLLLVAALFQLSDGAQCVGLGILRGIGDTKLPTIITLVAYWVIGLPLAWFLGFKTVYGPIGIWAGLSAGLTFSALALNFRFFYLQKKYRVLFENT